MNTHDTEIANKITTYLDRGTADLKAGTVYRLQQARAAALARLADPQTEVGVQMAHALAGGTGTLGGHPSTRANLRVWLGVAAFVAVAGFGWQQWQAFQQEGIRGAGHADPVLRPSDRRVLTGDSRIDQGLVRTLMAGGPPSCWWRRRSRKRKSR
jgi:hypothetical protein